MIGLFLRKSFYDFWDNAVAFMLMNIPFAAFLLSLYALAGRAGEMPAISLLGMIFLDVLYSLYSLFVSSCCYRVSRKRGRMLEGVKDIRKRIPHALFHSLISIVLALSMLAIGPFFISLNSVLSVAIGMTVILLSALFYLCFQYYFPIAACAQSDSPMQVLSRCLAFFMNHMKLSIVLFLSTAISLILSVLLGFIIPGISMVILLRMTMTRMIVILYEYLETHSDESMASLDWDAVYEQEYDEVDGRTLLGLLMPKRKE